MIRFYYHPTPNPAKVALMLEEIGLAYQLVPVDTSKGEQHKPEFRAINPNGKVPAIVDTEGPGGKEARVFEFQCDSALPRRQDRTAGRFTCGQTGALVVAVLHCDRHRAILGTGGALPARRSRKDILRHQSLPPRSRAPLRSARYPFERTGIHRRERLHDRRYLGVGMVRASPARIAG